MMRGTGSPYKNCLENQTDVDIEELILLRYPPLPTDRKLY